MVAQECGSKASPQQQQQQQKRRPSEESGEQHCQQVKQLQGPAAVRSLYHTFETWYHAHARGFITRQINHSDGQYGSMNEDALGGGEGRGSSDGSSTAAVDQLLSGLQLIPPRRSMQVSSQAAASLTPAQQSATGAAAKQGMQDAVGGPAATGTAQEPAGPQPVATSAALSGVPNNNTDASLLQSSGSTDAYPLKGQDLLSVLQQAAGVLPQSSPAHIKGDDTAATTATQTEDNGARGLGAPSSATANNAMTVTPREGASFWEQVLILWQRALKVRRFESLSGQNLAQLLIVALITGCLWWQKGRSKDVAAGADVLGLLFFEMLFPSFRFV